MKESSKKKLLVTASTFPRWEGDTEPRFVLDLASHMTDTFDVTVLVPGAVGAKNYEVMEGVEVVRYHYFPIHKWETLCYPGAIVPRIKEKKIRVLLVPFLFIALYVNLFKMLSRYDAVHAHWLIPQGIVQSFFQKPYLVTGHGGDVTSLNYGIIKKFKVRCLRNAKYVTVVSKYLKNEIEKLYRIENLDVIPMGCNTKIFGRENYISNYFEQGNKKVVLFVGRLAEKKGVKYLIEAMKKIDAILIIVGEGPLKKELEEQAEGIKEKIFFWGAKTHIELKTIFASADVFAAPSITAEDGDSEGLGLVILEAMASGVPIVASRSGGIKEIIEDGVNGLLCEEKNICELENAINKILLDEDLEKKLIKNAKERVKELDYLQITRKYKKIIMGMLESL